jgi:L-alanine-DL-glutamate epimerase-like enolase superfamily enzyme
VYASLLAVPVSHELAPEIAAWCAETGFVGTKWRFSAADQINLAEWLAALERIAVASGDCGLFIDAGGKMDSATFRQLHGELCALQVSWVEELSDPSRVCDQLTGFIPALASGEHAFDDADFSAIVDCKPVTVWQPELAWHGRISESVERMSVFADQGGLIVPHGAHLPLTSAVAAGFPIESLPMVECNVCLEAQRQAYLLDPILPHGGRVEGNAGHVGLPGEYARVSHEVAIPL